jgi:hypothetical protein
MSIKRTFGKKNCYDGRLSLSTKEFGIVLALAIIFAYLVARTAPDFETLALGDATRSVYGNYEGERIFSSTPKEALEGIANAKKRGLNLQLLWLGNSQLHAINQPAPTDETSPILLARSQRPRGVEVQAMSFPNGSLLEFYLAYLFQKEHRRIDVLILPLFLDDTREGTVREALRVLTESAIVRNGLDSVKSGLGDLLVSKNEENSATGVSFNNETLQDLSENSITKVLESFFGFQSMRERSRGQIEIWAYQLRNTVFQINSQTIRPIIAEAYELNMLALKAMLSDAAGAGTKVIMYIPPIRSDVDIPYSQLEYKRFKSETSNLAEVYGALFLDLDNIVPGPLWGTKSSTKLGGGPELDFMHFKVEGHKAVADAIRPIVEAIAGGLEK